MIQSSRLKSTEPKKKLSKQLRFFNHPKITELLLCPYLRMRQGSGHDVFARCCPLSALQFFISIFYVASGDGRSFQDDGTDAPMPMLLNR